LIFYADYLSSVTDISTSFPTICTSTAYHPYTQVEANKYMEVEQTKPAQKLLWAKEWRPHTVPRDNEACILLTNQLLDPLQKECARLLIEPLQCHIFDIFILLKSTTL